MKKMLSIFFVLIYCLSHAALAKGNHHHKSMQHKVESAQKTNKKNDTMTEANKAVWSKNKFTA